METAVFPCHCHEDCTANRGAPADSSVTTSKVGFWPPRINRTSLSWKPSRTKLLFASWPTSTGLGGAPPVPRAPTPPSGWASSVVPAHPSSRHAASSIVATWRNVPGIRVLRKSHIAPPLVCPHLGAPAVSAAPTRILPRSRAGGRRSMGSLDARVRTPARGTAPLTGDADSVRPRLAGRAPLT